MVQSKTHHQSLKNQIVNWLKRKTVHFVDWQNGGERNSRANLVHRARAARAAGAVEVAEAAEAARLVRLHHRHQVKILTILFSFRIDIAGAPPLRKQNRTNH